MTRKLQSPPTIEGQCISSSLASGRRCAQGTYLCYPYSDNNDEPLLKFGINNANELAFYMFDTLVWKATPLDPNDDANESHACLFGNCTPTLTPLSMFRMSSGGSLAAFDENRKKVWESHVEGINGGDYVFQLHKEDSSRGWTGMLGERIQGSTLVLNSEGVTIQDSDGFTTWWIEVPEGWNNIISTSVPATQGESQSSTEQTTTFDNSTASTSFFPSIDSAFTPSPTAAVMPSTLPSFAPTQANSLVNESISICNSDGSFGVVSTTDLEDYTQSESLVFFDYTIRNKAGKNNDLSDLVSLFEREIISRVACYYFRDPCMTWCDEIWGGNFSNLHRGRNLAGIERSVIGLSPEPKDIILLSQGDEMVMDPSFNVAHSGCARKDSGCYDMLGRFTTYFPDGTDLSKIGEEKDRIFDVVVTEISRQNWDDFQLANGNVHIPFRDTSGDDAAMTWAIVCVVLVFLAVISYICITSFRGKRDDDINPNFGWTKPLDENFGDDGRFTLTMVVQLILAIYYLISFTWMYGRCNEYYIWLEQNQLDHEGEGTYLVRASVDSFQCDGYTLYRDHTGPKYDDTIEPETQTKLNPAEAISLCIFGSLYLFLFSAFCVNQLKSGLFNQLLGFVTFNKTQSPPRAVKFAVGYTVMCNFARIGSVFTVDKCGYMVFYSPSSLLYGDEMDTREAMTFVGMIIYIVALFSLISWIFIWVYCNCGCDCPFFWMMRVVLLGAVVSYYIAGISMFEPEINFDVNYTNWFAVSVISIVDLLASTATDLYYAFNSLPLRSCCCKKANCIGPDDFMPEPLHFTEPVVGV